MSEQVFPLGSWEADDDRATTLVSDLVEELLDAISRPGHNWRSLDVQARELRKITGAMAAAYPPDAGARRDH